jgi:hypothetical protein
MTAAQHTLAEAVLLTILEMHPASTLEGLAALMRSYGCRGINKAWVYRTLHLWGYTHKRLYHVQQHKFTQLNIFRYIDHMFGVAELDPTRLKYLDESHFDTKSKHKPFHPHFICYLVMLMLFTAQVVDHEAGSLGAAPSSGRLPTTTSGSPSPLPHLSASPAPSPAGCPHLALAQTTSLTFCV